MGGRGDQVWPDALSVDLGKSLINRGIPDLENLIAGIVQRNKTRVHTKVNDC
jgi:hypothetical protein